MTGDVVLSAGKGMTLGERRADAYGRYANYRYGQPRKVDCGRMDCKLCHPESAR